MDINVTNSDVGLVHSFLDMGTKEKIDIVSYIEKYIESKPLATIDDNGNILEDGTKLYIGCDSQNNKKQTIYAIVIVLHYMNNGGKVLFSRYVVDRINDSYVRLWNEISNSVEVANFISDRLNIKPYYIELDLNPDPQFKSNSLLKSAMGYVESYGFRSRCKPNLLSTVMSDHICKKKRKRNRIKSRKK